MDTNDDTCRAGVPAPILELTADDLAWLAAQRRPSLLELEGARADAWRRVMRERYGPRAKRSQIPPGLIPEPATLATETAAVVR